MAFREGIDLTISQEFIRYERRSGREPIFSTLIIPYEMDFFYTEKDRSNFFDKTIDLSIDNLNNICYCCGAWLVDSNKTECLSCSIRICFNNTDHEKLESMIL